MDAAALLTLTALEQEDSPGERAGDDERRAFSWGFRVGTMMSLDLLAHQLATADRYWLNTALDEGESEFYERLEAAVVVTLSARLRHELEWNLGRILREDQADEGDE
jgi:hypothetical protein